LAIQTNLRLVKQEYDGLIKDLDMGIRLARDEMMNSVIQLAKQEIQGKRGSHKGPDGGTIWDKAESGRPPMNRTGNLRRSIKGFKFREGFGVYSAEVYPTMSYGAAVEKGGKYAPPSWKGTTAMKGFPYMHPAWVKFKQSGLMQQIIRKNLKDF